MHNLLPVNKSSDILLIYKNTPIELLLEYHNLIRPHDKYLNAQLLVGMCMNNRKKLNIPDNFAYILKAGGANFRYSDFYISYAIGGIKYFALIGHNDCGMVDLHSKKENFINGLIKNAGWDKNSAEELFTKSVTLFEIGNEIDFLISEVKRLRTKYPKITIAPFWNQINENNQIVEN